MGTTPYNSGPNAGSQADETESLLCLKVLGHKRGRRIDSDIFPFTGVPKPAGR
jgi:hypothetical protein